MNLNLSFYEAEKEGINKTKKKLKKYFDNFKRVENTTSYFDFIATKKNYVYLIEVKNRKSSYYKKYNDMLLEKEKLVNLISERKRILNNYKDKVKDVILIYVHTYSNISKIRYCILSTNLSTYNFFNKNLQKNHVINRGYKNKEIKIIKKYKEL